MNRFNLSSLNIPFALYISSSDISEEMMTLSFIRNQEPSSLHFVVAFQKRTFLFNMIPLAIETCAAQSHSEPNAQPEEEDHQSYGFLISCVSLSVHALASRQ